MRPTPDDVLDHARFLQRQRKRAADQSDADHGELAYSELPAILRDAHAIARFRLSRKRAFSVSSPTVTRRCSGMPYPPSGLTMTPASRSRWKTRPASATLNVTKLPTEGMNSSPRRVEAVHELTHAAAIDFVAARDELAVLERRGGGRERNAVHVERLAHAVHEIGHFRMSERVTHAQSGKSIHFRERARDHEIRIPARANRRYPTRTSSGRYSLYASSRTTST